MNKLVPESVIHGGVETSCCDVLFSYQHSRGTAGCLFWISVVIQSGTFK